MSEFNHALFIGGAADGRLLPVDTSQRCIEATNPRPEGVCQPTLGMVVEYTTEVDRYERRTLMVEGKPMVLYVVVGMTISDAMMRVFRRYTTR